MTQSIFILSKSLTILLIILLLTLILRLLYTTKCQIASAQRKPKQGPSHLVAILGSGGHSAEMKSLLRDLDPTRYTHRTYIASSEDYFAREKAIQIESSIQARLKPCGPTGAGIWDDVTGIWDVVLVKRARKIHQSLLTTLFSSLWCAHDCIRALYLIKRSSKTAPHEYPDVIIANGPATSVIFILSAAVLRLLGVAPTWKMKIIFVESWARVKSLSLSGRLLLRLGICDRFLVQWENLANSINKKGAQKVEWSGFLVD
ncbi:UDP-N-acetylglucosamine transferase subunit alg14 [Golovinomyces cichoracearum]|uniref:UDP-N-acetylglucosamine transferase subunit ALG14 n=1 Tax=Golovinomyces cichoracearum TaxID=62708 RepID=A0A420IDR4_9PEZI|nr:UDP-N-acetylglucosamine transferase subunit alg14 [Golovinomyces cichoracearum]